MNYDLKKKLFNYFAEKDSSEMTEEEQWLFRSLQEEICFFDTTSICREDLDNLGFERDQPDSVMDQLAHMIDESYVDYGDFNMDLRDAAVILNIGKKNE